jgi:hypothetical protein
MINNTINIKIIIKTRVVDILQAVVNIQLIIFIKGDVFAVWIVVGMSFTCIQCAFCIKHTFYIWSNEFLVFSVTIVHLVQHKMYLRYILYINDEVFMLWMYFQGYATCNCVVADVFCCSIMNLVEHNMRFVSYRCIFRVVDVILLHLTCIWGSECIREMATSTPTPHYGNIQ